MSVQACCSRNFLSTGRPGCVEIFAVTNGFTLAKWRDDDGNINGIPYGTVVDQTYVEGKHSATDYSQRWFSLPRAYRVVPTRAEMKTEDVEGVAKNTGEFGVRTYVAELLGDDSNVNMEKALEQFKCGQWGFLKKSKKGQIGGTNTGNGDLLFTKIEDDTFSAIPTYAQDGQIAKITIMFTVDETELDSDQDFIPASAIEYPVKYWYNSQPVQGYIEVVDSSALDEIVVNLHWMSKKADPYLLEEFVANDFNTDGVATVTNLTTSTTVAVTSVESTSTPGQYTLTLAVPASDQDEIEIDVVKTGYDFAAVTTFAGPTS